MRRFSAVVLVVLGLAGCGGGNAAPFINPALTLTSFALNPSPVELSDTSPAAVVTGQGDTAGVQYTAHTDSSCTGAAGSLAVAGDGIPQLDVAGAPLIFIVVASGTPPSSCTLTATGSDGSSASTQLQYSTASIDTSMIAASAQHVALTGTVTPANVTISSPTSVVVVKAAGFNGVTKATATCSNAHGAVSVFPSSFTGPTNVTIAPYGQGALSGTCVVSFADTGTQPATQLTVTLAAPALHKLTVSPSNVQFSCAGSLPQACTTQSVELAEVAAPKFQINPRPTLTGSCANAFNGPLKMQSASGTYANSVAGPQATVSFFGLLATPALNCSRIVVGDGNGQTVRVTVNDQLAAGSGTASAATCTGTDPLAPVPNAPHGMYVWNPYEVQGGAYQQDLVNYVIGKDPSFCGVSLVIQWSDVETQKGVFTWKPIDKLVTPYLKPGLRINLLFVDAPEVVGGNATPTWVFSQDHVAQINCGSSQPAYPNWIDPTFESDYEAFIAAAIAHYTTGAANSASYADAIGYMRFGIGAGSEAYPGHIARPPLPAAGDPCLNALKAQGWSYDAWLQHSLNIVRFMAKQKSDKQLMIALNYVATYATNTGNDPDAYTYANAVAAVAAPLGIGFGTENLGISGVAAASATPQTCNPSLQMINLYWCQAYYRHLGVVPFEFQPIVSPLNPLGYDVTIAHLFQYALDNNAQILEIYPQDWVYNDDPAAFPAFTGGTQVEYQAAFQATSLVLGRNPNAHP